MAATLETNTLIVVPLIIIKECKEHHEESPPYETDKGLAKLMKNQRAISLNILDEVRLTPVLFHVLSVYSIAQTLFPK